MPKATLNDEVNSLQWQPEGSGLLLQLGGAAVNLQAGSGSHLRSQGGLHRRLEELAGFSLVWSFVVCFLAGRGHASMEHPVLMAEVTPTGQTKASFWGSLSSIEWSFLTDRLTLFCGSTEAYSLNFLFCDMKETQKRRWASFHRGERRLCSGEILLAIRESHFVQ